MCSRREVKGERAAKVFKDIDLRLLAWIDKAERPASPPTRRYGCRNRLKMFHRIQGFKFLRANQFTIRPVNRSHFSVARIVPIVERQ